MYPSGPIRITSSRCKRPARGRAADSFRRCPSSKLHRTGMGRSRPRPRRRTRLAQVGPRPGSRRVSGSRTGWAPSRTPSTVRPAPGCTPWPRAALLSVRHSVLRTGSLQSLRRPHLRRSHLDFPRCHRFLHLHRQRRSRRSTRSRRLRRARRNQQQRTGPRPRRPSFRRPRHWSRPILNHPTLTIPACRQPPADCHRSRCCRPRRGSRRARIPQENASASGSSTWPPETVLASSLCHVCHDQGCKPIVSKSYAR